NEAGQLAEKQEWKNACRALYLSVLRLFAERDICEFMPARTNYEYYYVLARYPGLQGGFEDLATRVERIWFGGAEALSSDYDTCLSAHADLSREAEGIAARRPAAI